MKFGGIAAIELGAARLLMSQAQPAMPGMAPAAAQEISKADFTLRIAPVTVELTPTRIISTIGYNGTAPGPVLRMKEGIRSSCRAMGAPRWTWSRISRG